MARDPWPPTPGLFPADLAELTTLISRRQHEVELLAAAADATRATDTTASPTTPPADPPHGAEVQSCMQTPADRGDVVTATTTDTDDQTDADSCSSGFGGTR